MYTEETKNSINWGNVIKKGIIILVVALVIFFVIWLFVKNNNSNVDVNYNNGNNNSNSSLNSRTYSKEFLEGYRYFHDTSKEYFLISELPQNGKTLKYTLQELINKGLIFAWEYQDGKSCDTEASYAYVTNENGKYKLTITLVCGIEVAKTTEDLGCNQLCTNGNCQNTQEYITEYRFKQEYTDYETVYSCPKGYTKDGSKCVKNNDSTVSATKNVTYSCPNGYEAVGSGESMKCYKSSSDIIDANLNITYSCPSGYTRSGSKCYITGSSYTDADYNYVYSCDAGYELTGTGVNIKCVKNTTTSANPIVESTYSCPNGYTKSGSGSSTKCTKTVNATAKTSTSCPDGYTKSGSSCVKTVNPTTTTKYTCSSGTLVNSKYCRINIKESYLSFERYQGPAVINDYNVTCKYKGQYEDDCTNGNCTKISHKYLCPATTIDVDATPNTTYNCPDDYTKSGSGSSTKCTKTVNATTTTTYSCPNGYTKSGSGSSTKCTQTANATVNSTYSCPSGYTKSGSGSSTKCTKTTQTNGTVRKEKSYYCSYGILSGNKCYYSYEDSTNATANYTYSCPSGYTKNRTKCVYSYSDVQNAVKNTSYTCQSGYTKVGSGSSSKCTKGVKETINATKTTQKVTKYRYKWSTEKTLEGWTPTGETRESLLSEVK